MYMEGDLGLGGGRCIQLTCINSSMDMQCRAMNPVPRLQKKAIVVRPSSNCGKAKRARRVASRRRLKLA